MPTTFPGSSLRREISEQWADAMAKAGATQAVHWEQGPSAHRVESGATAGDNNVIGILPCAWHGVLPFTHVSLLGPHSSSMT